MHPLSLPDSKECILWECLAPSETVWETSWHRRRLSGSVWHRQRLSLTPLGTVVDCLGVSGTVRDYLGDVLAPSCTVWECLVPSETV
ncbi:hypothetical protein DPMN_194768 [Dreissena polymorpha]|uniref:Uncharacterized protein n=1 Tax=Dreissena polymorpha TaxID=45954 RepID=A0A9D3Y5G8_DREPO|nr:hypothetical protein DPMN_194768 [Dreissena polymorpha]